MSNASDSEPKQWCPSLFGKQLDVFNSRARILLVDGSRLAAKCVDADTIIQASNHLVRIKRIGPPLEKGEARRLQTSLWSMAGNTFTKAKTELLLRDPVETGFRITTLYGYEVNVSAKHPVWCCVDGQSDYRTVAEIVALKQSGVQVWVPLRCGFEGWTAKTYHTLTFPVWNENLFDKAALHKRIGKVARRHPEASWSEICRRAKTHHPRVRDFFQSPYTVPELTVTVNEEFAYLFGVLMGDGSFCKSALESKQVYLSTADPEILDSVKRICREQLGDEYIRKRPGKYDWAISSKKLLSVVRGLKLNKLAHEKFIPDCLIESPKSVVRAFLQGLFDTDGCAEKNGSVSYCSTSKPLAKDVQQLLLAFGIESSCHFYANSGRGAWKVCLYNSAQLFYERVGFRLTRKQAGSLRRRKPRQDSNAYPPAARASLWAAYLSRAKRGAPRGEIGTGTTRWRRPYDMCRRQDLAIGIDSMREMISFCKAENDPALAGYFMGGKVFWEPVQSVEPCEVDLYDLTVAETHNFVGNGFINHNTHACCHRIIRHLWETPGARYGIFAKSVKLAKDGGSWQYLLENCMPDWLGANILGQNGEPLEFLTRDAAGVPGPKVDSNTRTAYFRIRNWYGGSSECQLFSIDNINEIGAKVKNKYFSGMYFVELSNWEDQRVLSMTLPSLRMGHLTPPKGQPDIYHQWMGDTNPSEDLGALSWFYKLWYVEKNKPPTGDSHRKFLDMLEVIWMHWKDNPFATEEQVLGLEFSCGGDRAVKESHYDGVHGEGGVKAEKHFANFFIRSKHVIGGGPDEGDQIDVSASTTDLFTGWDLGNVNHGGGILERVYRPAPPNYPNPNPGQPLELPTWHVLDELVYLGEEVMLSEYTVEFMKKMAALEEFAGKKFNWIHWSDDSAINVFRPTTGAYDYVEILAASRGAIHLQGVNKPDGSQRIRVRMLRQLLREERILISSRCYHVIAMLEQLRKSEKEYVVRDDHIHTFDWLTYPMFAEMQDELMMEAFRPKATRHEERVRETGMVSV